MPPSSPPCTRVRRHFFFADAFFFAAAAADAAIADVDVFFADDDEFRCRFDTIHAIASLIFFMLFAIFFFEMISFSHFLFRRFAISLIIFRLLFADIDCRRLLLDAASSMPWRCCHADDAADAIAAIRFSLFSDDDKLMPPPRLFLITP